MKLAGTGAIAAKNVGMQRNKSTAGHGRYLRCGTEASREQTFGRCRIRMNAQQALRGHQAISGGSLVRRCHSPCDWIVIAEEVGL